MTLNELFKLKEKILGDLDSEINEADFPNHEAYKHHLYGAQEGIMIFFVHTMIGIIDEGDQKLDKKSA